MNEIAVMVGQDLDFDVFGPANVAFEENLRSAEGGAGFALCFFQPRWKLIRMLHDAHSSAATAETCLEDDGVADLLGRLLQLGRVVECCFRAGYGGNACFFGEV